MKKPPTASNKVVRVLQSDLHVSFNIFEKKLVSIQTLKGNVLK